jgi:hypothetical protein
MEQEPDDAQRRPHDEQDRVVRAIVEAVLPLDANHREAERRVRHPVVT